MVFHASTNLDISGQGGELCVFCVCFGSNESVVEVDLRAVDTESSRGITGAHIEGKSSGFNFNLDGLSRTLQYRTESNSQSSAERGESQNVHFGGGERDSG